MLLTAVGAVQVPTQVADAPNCTMQSPLELSRATDSETEPVEVVYVWAHGAEPALAALAGLSDRLRSGNTTATATRVATAVATRNVFEIAPMVKCWPPQASA